MYSMHLTSMGIVHPVAIVSVYQVGGNCEAEESATPHAKLFCCPIHPKALVTLFILDSKRGCIEKVTVLLNNLLHHAEVIDAHYKRVNRRCPFAFDRERRH